MHNYRPTRHTRHPTVTLTGVGRIGILLKWIDYFMCRCTINVLLVLYYSDIQYTYYIKYILR